jgi:hypothetical protein
MIRIISIIKKALQFLSISIRKNKSVSTTARKSRFSKDASNWRKVVFMAIRLEKTMHFINLPASFNYEDHILNFPPEQYGFVDPRNEGFKSMRMLYILWQIGESASKHERAWKKSGFIAVSGKTFQYRVQSYNPYLKYLINTGVIESDNHYSPLVIPLGYKFADRFSNEPLKRVDLSHGSISDTFDDNVSVFAYLTYWYSKNKLTIDTVAAREEAFRLYSFKKNNPEFWSRDKYGMPKEPLPQYYSAIQNISKIESGLFNLKISPKVHRLYSSITAMPSKYRNYLKYDNQSLGCIDIKNCQSYIACLILNPDFWKKDSTLPLNFYSLPQNVIDLFDSYLIIMIGEKFSSLESLEIFNEYIDLVSRGMIYQDMILWAQQEKERIVTKKKVKEVVFSTIFSPVNSRKTWLHDYYTEKFGQIIELFDIIKSDMILVQSDDNNEDVSELEDIEIAELETKKPHARLSILFQAIESEIILHKCCKRIFEESNHTVPIFTVHDCIITTQENLNYLESVMIEEFSIVIGYHPPLDIERW